MIRLDLAAEWAEHMTAEVGQHRWLSLPRRGGCGVETCPVAVHRDAPPAVLVAALEECETCDGEGCTYDGDVDSYDCHDCANTGRPLVEVTVPCWECGGCGTWDRKVGLTPCAVCAGMCRVSLGRYVVDMPDGVTEALRVREEAECGPVRDAITIDLNDPQRAWHFNRPAALPDPAARIGEWAVRLRRTA